MAEQLDLLKEKARQDGHRRARQAAEHADRTVDTVATWQETALVMLDDYRKDRGQWPFLTEQFRDYALARGLTVPPTLRAFGAVMLAAQARGKVKAGGYDLDRHGSPKTLWRWA